MYNDDHILKDIQEERNSNTNRGFTKEKTMRHVCQIPTFLFYNEPLLKEYHKNLGTDPVYAKRCLRSWLLFNPQYRCNSGGI